jgi:hypothetical protein
VCVCVCV